MTQFFILDFSVCVGGHPKAPDATEGHREVPGGIERHHEPSHAARGHRGDSIIITNQGLYNSNFDFSNERI